MEPPVELDDGEIGELLSVERPDHMAAEGTPEDAAAGVLSDVDDGGGPDDKDPAFETGATTLLEAAVPVGR